ncbi:alkaline phosphatase family protein [Segetibacter koreensis]|uniref:alkaline phosphatase family protein n=1 Tax=Segetibacter koreensis TaxID=398037 RepID=UPI00037820F2|nr:alkaline phosphatase family protein [Segetibacter koreensis]
MKKVEMFILLILIILFGCKKQAEQLLQVDNNSTIVKETGSYGTAAIPNSTATVPHVPSHIIFVWFENKDYNAIIGNRAAPYINSLITRGTLFTNTYGLTHPSYPNYIRFFSGQSNGVVDDNCISGSPFKTSTMYNSLKGKGVSFKWFSEGLPYAGSRTCSSGYYKEKHNPTTVFTQVPDTINQPITAMNLTDTSKYKYLPRVACVTPNMINDMHDGTINQGDTWFKKNFSKLIDWSIKHNSIVVVYFDESESGINNRIPVIAVGQYVAANLKLVTKYDHYNWTKTVCAMFGANNTWTSNLNSRQLITGCWK